MIRVIAGNNRELEPQYCLEGDEPVFAIKLMGITTVTNDATLVQKAYRGSTDKTTEVVTGSSFVVANGPPAQVTLKKLSGLKPGEYYITLRGTFDGVLDSRSFRLYVGAITGLK